MARHVPNVSGGTTPRHLHVAMDTATPLKQFMDRLPVSEADISAFADSSVECQELVVNALNFHRNVVEALIRFAEAASEDSADLTACAIERPEPQNLNSETAFDSLIADPILLTPRETEVLKLIAQGNSSKQVAFALGISFKTAVCHRYNIMEKLNIHDVSGLVRYAIRKGLIRP